MSERLNKNPISLREGKVYIDGREVLDCVKCELYFVPEVWEGRRIGSRALSRRYLGYTVRGRITERRSSPWLAEALKKYIKGGVTPEFTIQGISADKNSDYYTEYKSIKVTAKGCVLTGSVPLLALDTDGDVLTDEIAFSAAGVTW